jgi:hypothetical protein
MEQVGAVPDDLERYELATRASESLKVVIDRFAQVREGAVLGLVDQRLSLQKVADQLNLTKSRVQALTARADNRRAERRHQARDVDVDRRKTPDRRASPATKARAAARTSIKLVPH